MRCTTARRKEYSIFIYVDPIAEITLRIEVDKADAEHLAWAMEQIKVLGADLKVIVSDPLTSCPEEVHWVWPRAERHLY